MVEALIAAGAGLLGSYLNSEEARKQNNKNQAALDKQKGDLDNWYRKRYYEDGIQRADMQRAIEVARQNLIKENKAIAGKMAVMGGSNAVSAAMKEKANEALGNAVADIAAKTAANKDAIEERYMTGKSALENQQLQLDNDRSNQKMANTAAAAQAVGTAAQGFASAGANNEIAESSKAATANLKAANASTNVKQPVIKVNYNNGTNPTAGNNTLAELQKSIEERQKIWNGIKF